MSSNSIIRQVVQSKEFKWAIGGWTFFIAENAILSENRTYLITALGGDESNYHLMYGTLSTTATASIGYAYYHLTRKNPILVSYFKNSSAALVPKPPPLPIANVLVSWTCLSVGLVLASQALPKMQIPIRFTTSTTSSSSTSQQQQQQQQQPAGEGNWKLSVQCPFDFSDKYKDNNSSSNNNSNVVTGVDRVSRHVGLWSLGLISVAQAVLISIPSTATTAAAASASAGTSAAAATVPASSLFTALWSLRLWWCGPLAVAWLGGMHNDSRFRRGIGGTLNPYIDCQTSNIPFLAMLTGKQGSSRFDAFWNLCLELKPLNAIIATTMATLWIMTKGRRRASMSLFSSSGGISAKCQNTTAAATTAANMSMCNNTSKMAMTVAAASSPKKK
jgi:hypothetical protein